MERINNDEIRKFIYESIMNCINSKEDEIVVNCYEEYSQKLQNIKDIPLMNMLYPAILNIVYTDTYMVLNMKMKSNDTCTSDKELFNQIKLICDYNDLVIAIENDDTLLAKLLEKCTNFYDMSYLRKIIAVNSLNYAQQNFLLMKYPLFENDFEKYNEDVTITTLGDYCKEEFDDYISINGNTDIENFEDNIIDELNGFVNFLVGNNMDLYMYIMGKLLETDYKWHKYLKEHNYYTQEEDFSIDMRLQMYEEYNHDELVTDECMVNFEYVEELLASFILIKCYNMNVDPRVINQEKIDEYFSKKTTLNKSK